MIRKTLTASACILLSACAGTPYDWSDARKIQVGMTQPEVTSIMGKPYLVKSTADGETWVWSWTNMFSGNRTVSAVFRDGKVIKAPPIPESFR